MWPSSVFAELPNRSAQENRTIVALVKLEAHAQLKTQDGARHLQVTVRNPEKGVAFMVHLRVARREGGEDVTPILWDDNYFSLLPGEKREITAHYETVALHGKHPALEVSGWNILAGNDDTPRPSTY